MPQIKNVLMNAATATVIIATAACLAGPVQSSFHRSSANVMYDYELAGTIPAENITTKEHVLPISPMTISEFATVPGADTQPTGRGKTVHDMYVYNNELYAGYGDYNDNTGPVNITALNLASNTWSNYLNVPNEETSVWREINGKLYTPYTDPRLSWTAKVGYSTNASGVWENVNTTPFIHVYDVATSDGEDLWLAGSVAAADGSPAGAAVKRSVDGGVTWQTVLNAQSKDPAYASQEFDRYYWLASAGGKIYTRGQIGGGDSVIDVWNNGAWSAVPVDVSDFSVYSGNQVVTFKDKIYSNGRTLVKLDPATDTVSSVPNITAVTDFYETSEALYALSSSGTQVYVTYDGEKWLNVPLPVSEKYYTSLAVNNNQLFLSGSGDAKIYQADLTEYLNYVNSDPVIVDGLDDIVLSVDSDANLDELFKQGIDFYDVKRGDITSTVAITNNVDVTKTGYYMVSYSYVNGKGETAGKDRAVQIIENEEPELRATTALVRKGSSYDPQGYVQAYDDISKNVTVTSETNTNVNSPGFYLTTYTGTDEYGKKSVLKVPVIVLPF